MFTSKHDHFLLILSLLLLSCIYVHNVCVACAKSRYITVFMRITYLPCGWLIKGQKRQRVGVMHLNEFTQANHLHLQTICFTLVVTGFLRKWSLIGKI